MSADLGAALLASARTHADRVAVDDIGGDPLSYAELFARADAFATQIAELPSRRPRRQVLMTGPNCNDYIAAMIGALLAGAVPFLLDPALAPAEVNRVITDCGIDAVARVGRADGTMTGNAEVTSTAGIDLAPTAAVGEDFRPTVLDSTALCRFTSGSTRTPACVEFADGAVLGAARAWLASSPLAPDERILCFAGLYNGLAFNTSLIPGLLRGAHLFLPRAVPTAGYVAHHLRRSRPHVLVGFPALYLGLSRHTRPVEGTDELRAALSSATRLDPELTRAVRDLHGIRVADYYGIAETGPLTVNDLPDQPGQQGRPLDGVEIVETADHELAVRSTSMGSRYLNHPGRFEARLTPTGFYRTGDSGTLSGGRVVLGGRIGKDLDIGGKKVSCAEVEQALRDHPAVQDVYVLGLTLETGERVVGALAVADRIGPNALRTHCAELLAAHKIPAVLRVVAAIPRGSTGKVRSGEATRLLNETIFRTDILEAS